MKYIIEDTPDGYRLSIAGGSSAQLISTPDGLKKRGADEIGGHGPIEDLYRRASELWTELRLKATG